MASIPPLEHVFRTGSLILILLCGWSGPVWAAEGKRLSSDPELYPILSHAAWVQGVVVECGHDASKITGRLTQVHDDWLKRNADLRKALHMLEAVHHAEEAGRAKDLFVFLKAEAQSIFTEKRETDPEDFARECDAFTEELAAGIWDYPAGNGSSR